MTDLPTRKRTQRSSKDKKRDDVYREIRTNIIQGKLQTGDVLNETELAEHYGISRTPVREALLMLVVEEFLRGVPRAGYVVTEVTVRDIQDSFHLREVLETEAARLAAKNITDEMLTQLEATKVIQQDADDAAAPEIIYNRDFHLLIAQASGNRRLVQMLEKILDNMERILAYDPHHSNAHDAQEHGAIVEALRQKDPQASQQAMRAHIRAVRSRILERF